MSDTEKDLTYEEAKELCKKAFDAGADYVGTSLQFNCNAVAYDWEHWLKKNERLFMPKPTVEGLLREFAAQVTNGGRVHGALDIDSAIAECAPLLRLAGDE